MTSSHHHHHSELVTQQLLSWCVWLQNCVKGIQNTGVTWHCWWEPFGNCFVQSVYFLAIVKYSWNLFSAVGFIGCVVFPTLRAVLWSAPCYTHGIWDWGSRDPIFGSVNMWSDDLQPMPPPHGMGKMRVTAEWSEPTLFLLIGLARVYFEGHCLVVQDIEEGGCLCQSLGQNWTV